MGKKIADKLTVNLADCKAKIKLYNHFLKLLERQENYSARPLVLLCIGSDRYTGDSLGPLVGSQLEEDTDAIIHGSLDYPVHAGNLVEIIAHINHQYHNPIVIAIDACLGKSDEIGNIEMWEGGLHAGIAVGNRLPCVGHISIVGVVNSGGQIGYLDLQSTPLSIVMKLSKVIGCSLSEAINTVNPTRSEKVLLG
ncbi:spore protease YyaC [Dendrosporobacter sp. 1207_IL3150]|uniref:spore protease YyaC n=1 Tax=Dendrosporobacter sp. 1207_IL3150 TaxID=3084054 RepID=UPI002FD8D593